MRRFGWMARILIAVVALITIVVASGVAAEAKGKPKKRKTTTKSVTVGDNFFKPTSLTVSANSTVNWHWTGKAPHNVTATGGPAKFHSATQTKGSYSHKFTAKGTYQIVCTIHAPNMKMTVIVK